MLVLFCFVWRACYVHWLTGWKALFISHLSHFQNRVRDDLGFGPDSNHITKTQSHHTSHYQPCLRSFRFVSFRFVLDSIFLMFKSRASKWAVSCFENFLIMLCKLLLLSKPMNFPPSSSSPYPSHIYQSYINTLTYKLTYTYTYTMIQWYNDTNIDVVIYFYIFMKKHIYFPNKSAVLKVPYVLYVSLQASSPRKQTPPHPPRSSPACITAYHA